MNRRRATIVLLSIMAIGSVCTLFQSCRKKSTEGMIIFTQVIQNGQNPNNLNEESWRFIPQTRILSIDPANHSESVKVLTKEFFSARSPEISPDGNFMLFAAQKKQNDQWQICEMNLNNLKTRQITSSTDNCLDPAYLPGERFVFSRRSSNDTLKTDHSLFTGKLDGTDYYAPSVLRDGRILTISRQIQKGRVDQKFIVLRPDGTKAEQFYKGPDNSALMSRGLETIDGKIVFIETGSLTVGGGNITSINYNRPLHSNVNLTSRLSGTFYYVFPLKTGKLLVSYRPSDTEHYALYEFDPETSTLGKNIYQESEYDVLQVVMVQKHERPKKLPSEVDMGVKSGLLLCQNINVFDPESMKTIQGMSKASRIEILGVDSTLGVVDVERDGSFYLKVIADTPFRIQTIDEKGGVLHGPSGWMWLRPNERRGCVGCHEDPERVPENLVPLAVKNPPVNIPVHISKVKEKKVSLE
jgi:hypothetical protein